MEYTYLLINGILQNYIFQSGGSIANTIMTMACVGVIFIFAMVYIILYVKTRDFLHLIVLLITSSVFLYVLFSLFVNLLSTQPLMLNATMRMNRLAHISFLCIITIIPLFFQYYFYNNKLLKNLNIFLFFFMILVTLFFSVVMYAYPGLFISMTEVETSRVSGSSFSATGYLYEPFRYIVVFVFVMTVVSSIGNMIIHKEIKRHLLILIVNIINLVFVYETVFNVYLIKEIMFSRLVLGMTMITVLHVMVVFKVFADNSVNSIIKLNSLRKSIDKNKGIITQVESLLEKVVAIDKQIMDNAMCTFDVVKENKDAYDIIYSKSDELDITHRTFSSTAEKINENMSLDNKYINSIFEGFIKIRADINQSLKEIIDNFSNISRNSGRIKDFSIVSKSLKDASVSLSKVSKTTFQSIQKTLSQFSNVNDITDSIYESISFIKDMTNKTNLLSINAGIQASKAGFIGKSFAVVAKEIGSLAFESSKATDKIDKMLTDIFAALVAIENSSYKIQEDYKEFTSEIDIMIDKIDMAVISIESYAIRNTDRNVGIQLFDNGYMSLKSKMLEQESMIDNIKKNIEALFSIDKSLSEKIINQKNEIEKLFDDINNLISLKEELSGYTAEIGTYSSKIHTETDNMSILMKSYKIKEDHQSLTLDNMGKEMKSKEIKIKEV